MGVLYANNASTTLATAITSAATSLTVATNKGSLFPVITGTDYFYVTLTNAGGAVEIVKVTARSGDVFTVIRAQDGSTASSWAAGDSVELRITKAVLDNIKVDALTNPTLVGAWTEQVFAITGSTPALSPSNGTIQTWVLSANSTPTVGLWNSGQSLTLMIEDSAAYTISWGSIAVLWKTNGGLDPSLNQSGYTTIQLWKVGTSIYGARVGDA